MPKTPELPHDPRYCGSPASRRADRRDSDPADPATLKLRGGDLSDRDRHHRSVATTILPRSPLNAAGDAHDRARLSIGSGTWQGDPHARDRMTRAASLLPAYSNGPTAALSRQPILPESCIWQIWSSEAAASSIRRADATR